MDQERNSRRNLVPTQEWLQLGWLAQRLTTLLLFWHYKQWRAEGVIEKIRDVLHGQVREPLKKNTRKTLIIIDSQAVKNTYNPTVKSKGFCFYKGTNGIKRHLLIAGDFRSSLTAPKGMCLTIGGWLKCGQTTLTILNPSRPELPKTTILLDHGYHPNKIKEELEKIYPEIMTRIKFERSPKLSKAQKKNLGKSGFIPVKAPWVIERSNAWMERCKSLVKNFERTLENATANVNFCFVRLMVKRLATS